TRVPGGATRRRFQLIGGEEPGVIRIGVVEDDPLGVDVVLSHLDRLQRETGERFKVRAFSDGAEILRSYQPHWDLLLLDIQMQDVDGMEDRKSTRLNSSHVSISYA